MRRGQTQRVTYVDGNWTAAKEGGSGSFELQVITEDDTRHALHVTAEEMVALVAMTQASRVMPWDPAAGTLIAGNLAGEWIQHSWSAGEQRQAGRPH